MKYLSEQIVAWMKNYAYNNNRKAWVLGVSGGVDSGLASTLCAKTGLPTHLMILPCQTTAKETERGEAHIKWLMNRYLNVRRHKFDLTSTFEAFAAECAGNGFENPLGFANSKSRLRMITLYQLATIVGGLVVGTGNKVEDGGVRFFTKYGDGGVDISPIGDLYKSEVRQMCRELGMLPEISEAVPTDGLWNDTRTDESQLGATYDELEWAMKYVGNGPGDTRTIQNQVVQGVLTARQNEVLKTYLSWNRAGAHKMMPIPTFVRQ